MFVEMAQAGGTIAAAPSFADILLKAFDFLLTVATIVSIIALVIAGTMYFFAAGDKKRMDRAKSALTGSIAGIAIIAGIMVIIYAIIGFFE